MNFQTDNLKGHFISDVETDKIEICGASNEGIAQFGYKSGTRSAYATASLGILGYTDVKSMKGGFTAYLEAGYEVE